MKRRKNLERMRRKNTRAERSFIFPLGIDDGSSTWIERSQKRTERRRGKKGQAPFDDGSNVVVEAADRSRDKRGVGFLSSRILVNARLVAWQERERKRERKGENRARFDCREEKGLSLRDQ